MKNRYLNAVYTNLILERDYDPIRNQDGGFVLTEEMKVLQRSKNGVHLIVELIDGDKLNTLSISQRLAAAHQMLVESDPQKTIHFIAVFVFQGKPVTEIRTAITYEANHHQVERKHLSCMIVDLDQKTITPGSRSSLPTDGIDKLLKRFLSSPNDEYELFPDLSKIMTQKSREYSIRFKAKKPIVTYTLLGINIAVWVILSAISFIWRIDYNILTITGSKISEYIVLGQYWRLLTPIFLHAGPDPFHLLVNSYSLYILGREVERIFGHVKFLIVYILAGIIGNIASFSLFHVPHVQGVGASGAIFGLLGAVLYYGLENPKVFKKYFGYNVFATIILNVAIGFSLANIIDNFAHLGGLTGGFLVAGIVRVNADPQKFPGRYLFLATTVILTLAVLFYGINYWAHIIGINI